MWGKINANVTKVFILLTIVFILIGVSSSVNASELENNDDNTILDINKTPQKFN